VKTLNISLNLNQLQNLKPQNTLTRRPRHSCCVTAENFSVTARSGKSRVIATGKHKITNHNQTAITDN
jgi:hypothetical protein